MSTKAKATRKIINEALDILSSVGIPLASKKERGLEKMAMSMLAVAGVTTDWPSAKGAGENRHLKTREIITFINENFEENILTKTTAKN